MRLSCLTFRCLLCCLFFLPRLAEESKWVPFSEIPGVERQSSKFFNGLFLLTARRDSRDQILKTANRHVIKFLDFFLLIVRQKPFGQVAEFLRVHDRTFH